jgi:hypothetical protein
LYGLVLKEEYAKNLLSIIYECINTLINNNGYLEYMIANSTTGTRSWLGLHGINYKGVQYVPGGEMHLGTLVADLKEFFLPYFQS